MVKLFRRVVLKMWRKSRRMWKSLSFNLRYTPSTSVLPTFSPNHEYDIIRGIFSLSVPSFVVLQCFSSHAIIPLSVLTSVDHSEFLFVSNAAFHGNYWAPFLYLWFNIRASAGGIIFESIPLVFHYQRNHNELKKLL